MNTCMVAQNYVLLLKKKQFFENDFIFTKKNALFTLHCTVYNLIMYLSKKKPGTSNESEF